MYRLLLRFFSTMAAVSLASLANSPLLTAAVTEVTLSPTTTPTSSDTGFSVTAFGYNFPAGSIQPVNVTVLLAPATAGSGPTATTIATGVTVISGSTERVAFTVPSSLTVAAATLYNVSISGTTSAGKQFQSSNTTALTVNGVLAITNGTTLPTGTVGASYSVSLIASGGTGIYSWSLISGHLPPGLKLTAGNGLISGQPDAAGTFTARFQVKDSDGLTATGQFTLMIDPALSITTNSPLPAATVNAPYSIGFRANGGNGQYNWSVASGSLPGGLSLTATTGALSGTPTTSGTFSFTVAVTDTTKASASKLFGLTVNPALVISTASPLSAGTVGSSYSETLTASGGSGQYSWSLSSGTLPAGLALTAASGVISGIPSLAATSNFGITVTDTNQVTAAKTFFLTINSSALILSLSPAAANAGVSLQVAVEGSNTHFAQGVTQANFGPGITVTSLTVSSPTAAVAQITVSSTAAVDQQTVTLTTLSEQASIVNGFTVLASIPVISVNTSSPIPLASGFSGFDDEYLINGVEYWDPKYVAMLQPLKPGWVRYPCGTPSMGFDWQLSHMNATWMTNLEPLIGTYFSNALKSAELLTQAKGGASFADYGTLLQTVGANGIVAFNGFTDTRTDSAYIMAAQAKTQGSHIIEWELDNEPFVFPTIYPNAASYASAMYNPYDTNILGADPTATVGVFYQGQFDWQKGNYMAWDNGMTAYSPKYWNGISYHVYPVTDAGLTTAAEEQTLNGFLAHGTTEYFNSYIEPLIGPNLPVFITEMNSGTATAAFAPYIYNAVFLTEFIARMSTIPQVKAVGVSELYLGNSYTNGIIRAVDDFESYLYAQVNANPNYSTDTSTNPDTQFSFYYSTSGLALQIANTAVNGSNAVWPTAVYGSPTVPISGYDGNPVPSLYAQGYRGVDGTNYLLVTNKAGTAVPVAIEGQGDLLETTLTVSYISSTSDTAQNTATEQNNVQIVNTTSANPVMIGPYSVTRIQW